MEWWSENKIILEKKYGITAAEKYSQPDIYVWNFGSGYLPLSKYDRLCFSDLAAPDNCINKERLLTVSVNKQGETVLITKGSRYLETADHKWQRLPE